MTTGLTLVAGAVAAVVLAFGVFATTGFGLAEDYEAPAVTLPLARAERGATDTFAVAPGGLHDLQL